MHVSFYNKYLIKSLMFRFIHISNLKLIPHRKYSKSGDGNLAIHARDFSDISSY